MNLVRRDKSKAVIRQIPFLLLFVTAIFSLPFLGYAFSQILNGVVNGGVIFNLLLGFLMLWLLLEFVATREVIKIDFDRKILTHRTKGVFRKKIQTVDLDKVKEIVLEIELQMKGTRRMKREYLYLVEDTGRHLLNSPSKVYLNHGKLGKLLHEITSLPYQVRDLTSNNTDLE